MNAPVRTLEGAIPHAAGGRAPVAAAKDEVVLQVDHLTKHFPVRRGIIRAAIVGQVRAVDDVSFAIRRGETLALVGESGCGKSTTGRLIMRLMDPTSGAIHFKGQDLASLDQGGLRRLRRHIQIIFQDPYASLNPRLTVGQTLAEPLAVHGIAEGAAAQGKVGELLAAVGLLPEHARRYPHQFSGGQRQRIGIARALAGSPDLIVCDEPVSALDVSIQAQVVNLLQNLQQRLGLAYLFIAHDLAVVKHIADRVAVMYMGKLVEIADKRALYANPRHPYTQALLSAIPVPNPGHVSQRILLPGDVPSALNPPAGCRFHTRCLYAQARCRQEEPALAEIAGGHRVACHFAASIPVAQTAVSDAVLGGKLAERLAVYEAMKDRGRDRATAGARTGAEPAASSPPPTGRLAPATAPAQAIATGAAPTSAPKPTSAPAPAPTPAPIPTSAPTMSSGPFT